MKIETGDTVCFFDDDNDKIGTVVDMENVANGFVCVDWGNGFSSVQAVSDLIAVNKPSFT